VGHKRTEITIETDCAVVIRRQNVFRAWCPECDREAEMVDASEVLGVGTVTISPGLRVSGESQGWHISENQDGTLLICLESLLKSPSMRLPSAQTTLGKPPYVFPKNQKYEINP